GSSGLEPGEYHFFYLPRSRWVVAAEPHSSQTESFRDIRDSIEKTIGGLDLRRPIRSHVIAAITFGSLAVLAAWPYAAGDIPLTSDGLVDGPAPFSFVFALVAIW